MLLLLRESLNIVHKSIMAFDSDWIFEAIFL